MLYIEDWKKGDRLKIYARSWDVETSEKKQTICMDNIKVLVHSFDLVNLDHMLQSSDVVDLMVSFERADPQEE